MFMEGNELWFTRSNICSLFHINSYYTFKYSLTTSQKKTFLKPYFKSSWMPLFSCPWSTSVATSWSHTSSQDCCDGNCSCQPPRVCLVHSSPEFIYLFTAFPNSKRFLPTSIKTDLHLFCWLHHALIGKRHTQRWSINTCVNK